LVNGHSSQISSKIWSKTEVSLKEKGTILVKNFQKSPSAEGFSPSAWRILNQTDPIQMSWPLAWPDRSIGGLGLVT